MKRFGVGLCVLFWASLSLAQEAESQASMEPQQSADEKDAAKMAAVLNPKDYGPAFNIGAQAELIVPSAGLSSILLGYDAVWMQVDLSVGMGIGGDLEQTIKSGDTYLTSIRLGFPVHRGVRADFSLLVGGGVTVVDPSDGSTETLGQAGFGARFRAFFTPNLAVAGTIGAVFAFGRGEVAALVLARPLGAAAVIYFFR